ncbi:MAG TPA: ABC transporter substrate-binding protein, partial [Steroidobacteraceae bacterium]|nr:ABC transporter substrate-binding protein [Steroidobacteraceae bacterium]
RLPKFKDPRVRKALSLALDREAITDRIVRSGDRPAYGLVPSGIPGYYPALEPPQAFTTGSARLTEARRLLAAAGYGAGRPLEVELLYHNSEEHRKVAIVAAAMWGAVGVKTLLRNADRQVVDAAARNGQFEIVRLALFAGYVDPTGFFNAVREGSPANGSGYASATLERLFTEASSTADRANRAKLLRQAERVAIEEDQALIPLYFLMSRRLVAARVKGWPAKNLTALRPARYLSVVP